MINDEQWNQILGKYQKLIYHISHRIGGDNVCNDMNDSYQDLSIACIEAVKAYRKKTCEKFDDFFETEGFDKYLKTVLWNCKNNKGSNITKRAHINRAITLEESIIDAEMHHLDASSTLFEDSSLDDDCRSIVDAIHKNPKLIKPNGSINLNALSEELNEDKGKVKLYINKLETELTEYWEN